MPTGDQFSSDWLRTSNRLESDAGRIGETQCSSAVDRRRGAGLAGLLQGLEENPVIRSTWWRTHRCLENKSNASRLRVDT